VSQDDTPPPGHISMPEAAVRLRVPRSSVWRMVMEGSIDSVRDGRRWWLSEASVAARTVRHQGAVGQPPGHITFGEAAARLGVTEGNARSLAARGLLSVSRTGGRIWVSTASVRERLRGHPAPREPRRHPARVPPPLGFLSGVEAAERLGVSIQMLAYFARSGQVERVQAGPRRSWVSEASVMRLREVLRERRSGRHAKG